MLSSPLTFSPAVWSLENLICLSPLALQGGTWQHVWVGGAEGTVRRELRAHQSWPPQMGGQGELVAFRVTMATKNRSCLVPCPAAMVQEEGRGQRLGPAVLHTDVSHSPVSDRHCTQGATDPSQPLPHPAQTLPPLCPTEGFRSQ